MHKEREIVQQLQGNPPKTRGRGNQSLLSHNEFLTERSSPESYVFFDSGHHLRWPQALLLKYSSVPFQSNVPGRVDKNTSNLALLPIQSLKPPIFKTTALRGCFQRPVSQVSPLSNIRQDLLRECTLKAEIEWAGRSRADALAERRNPRSCKRCSVAALLPEEAGGEEGQTNSGGA